MDILHRILGCPETAFFFAPVPLYGWYRRFLTTVFIIGLVGFTILVILILLKMIGGLIERLETWAHAGSRLPSSDPATPV
jgi:hypothetical protein